MKSEHIFGLQGKIQIYFITKKKNASNSKKYMPEKKPQNDSDLELINNKKFQKNQIIFMQLYKIAQKGGVTKNTNLLFLSHYCIFIIQVVKYPCNEYFGENVPI